MHGGKTSNVVLMLCITLDDNEKNALCLLLILHKQAK